MGEEPGVGNHPVVGADRLALHVPGAMEHLTGSGSKNRLPASVSRSCITWTTLGV